jgi:hypothetical protein
MGEIIKCVKTVLAQASEEFGAVQTMGRTHTRSLGSRGASHALHTYWVGNLRLVLDMQLRGGKEHSSGQGKAGLGQLLEELGTRGPALVRGVSGYGNQNIIEICEKHKRRYLQRLRKIGGAGGRTAMDMADWLRTSWRYAAVWVGATTLSTLLLSSLTHFGLNETWSKLGVEMAMPFLNFIVARLWVFKTKS